VRAISVPCVLPRKVASSALISVGLTKPLGERLPVLRLRLAPALVAVFNSREDLRSSVRNSTLSADRSALTCWSLEEKLEKSLLTWGASASGAAAEASVEATTAGVSTTLGVLGARTFLGVASTTGAAALAALATATTGAAEAAAGAVLVLGVLGAFTTAGAASVTGVAVTLAVAVAVLVEFLAIFLYSTIISFI